MRQGVVCCCKLVLSREMCLRSAGLQADVQLGTLVSRSMQKKDNGSVELLLVLDGILQVGPDHLHATNAACKGPLP